MSIVCIFIILVFAFGMLYQFGGLRYYIRAVRYVKSLPISMQPAVINEFYGIEQNTYMGILAGVWREKVWVWGKNGLRYFNTDENSVYSLLDSCNQSAINAMEEGKTIEVIPKHIFSLPLWEKRVHTGDYVEVRITSVENGGVLGNLREVYAYTWWPFVVDDGIMQCGKLL